MTTKKTTNKKHMKKTIIAYSDLHTHDYKPHNDDNGRLGECLDVLDYVKQTAAKEDADLVLFAGDMTEEHKHIDSRIIRPLCEHAMELHYAGVDFWYITGNHDQYEKHSSGTGDHHSTVDFLRYLPGTHCLDYDWKDSGEVMIYGLPYIRDREKLQENLETISAEAMCQKDGNFTTHILMLHNYPDFLADQNEYIKTDFDAAQDLFEHFDAVIFGHYHESVVKRMANTGTLFVGTGNPIHRTWSDADKEKFIYALDIDTKADHKVTARPIRTDHIGRRFCKETKPRKTRPDITERKINVKLDKHPGSSRKFATHAEKGNFGEMIDDFGRKEKLDNELINTGKEIIEL